MKLRYAMFFLFSVCGFNIFPSEFGNLVDQYYNAKDVAVQKAEEIKVKFVLSQDKKTVKCISDTMIMYLPASFGRTIENFSKPLEERQKLISEGKFLNRVVLFGPPGNGKTLLAEEVIKKLTQANLKYVKASELVDRFQSSGAENLKYEFDQVIRESEENRIVFFIDEVDKIAGKRNDTHFRLDDDAKATTQLWLSLDQIKNNPNILVIVATNNLKSIHPTLASRFGLNAFEMLNPDKNQRKELIELFISKKSDISIDKNTIDHFVSKTDTFGIRFIKLSFDYICDEAVARNKGKITKELINEAIEKQKQLPQYVIEEKDKKEGWGTCIGRHSLDIGKAAVSGVIVVVAAVIISKM